MHRIATLFVGLILSVSMYAQIGGNYTYEFLGLPSSARLTALGGTLVAVEDYDVNLAADNPALLNSLMHNYASFSYDFLFDDIHNGSFAYGRTFDSLGITAHATIEFSNYGEFINADIYGNKMGTFSGKEASFTLGASKSFQDKISIGANIKMITGNIESYQSFGMAMDIGMLYRLPQKNLNIGLTFKNIGKEFSSYADYQGSAPFDIQLGVSKRLKYIPFRLSVTAHQLQQWNVRKDDEATQGDDVFGNPMKKSSLIEKRIDNLFRHLIFGGEFLIGKSENLRLRIAYNHMRRKELSVSEFRSLAGFSGGFGLSVRGFKLDYGIGYHHVVGGTNHLSVATDLDRFFK